MVPGIKKYPYHRAVSPANNREKPIAILPEGEKIKEKTSDFMKSVNDLLHQPWLLMQSVPWCCSASNSPQVGQSLMGALGALTAEYLSLQLILEIFGRLNADFHCNIQQSSANYLPITKV